MRWTWLMVMAACSGGSATPVDTVPYETCPSAVTDWCAVWDAPYGCPPTWTSAHDKGWCNLALTLYDCGVNHVAVSGGIDTHVDLEYDASGALFRIDSFGVTNRKADPCTAGAGPQLVVTDRCKVVATPGQICGP